MRCLSEEIDGTTRGLPDHLKAIYEPQTIDAKQPKPKTEPRSTGAAAGGQAATSAASTDVAHSLILCFVPSANRRKINAIANEKRAARHLRDGPLNVNLVPPDFGGPGELGVRRKTHCTHFAELLGIEQELLCLAPHGIANVRPRAAPTR